MKQYFCVGSYLPFDSINKSPLNTSKAKQAFSFSKSKRFGQYKPNCNIVSYQSNAFKFKKSGAKIGSSKRAPIIVDNQGPSPAHYRLKTQAQKEGHTISFGLNRQKLIANSYLNIQSKQYPPSTKYQVSLPFKKLLQKRSPCYSMKKRFITQESGIVSPGPAQYNLFSRSNSKLQLTKYKSLSFSTSKSKRFQNQETQKPGPGAYKPEQDKSIRLGFINSKFVTKQGPKFTHAQRKTYIDDQTKRRLSLPGPGNYRAPSQFGQYDGRIYEMFEHMGQNTKQFIRYDTDIGSGQRNRNSRSLKRPSTSKH